MSTTSLPRKPDLQRLRIRFRKEDDLRWISHRDLVRTMERLFRRAGLAMRMSEGFHPKPKMSFPSALALGIEGRGEIMELELTQPVQPEQLRERLNTLAPPGLVIGHVDAVTGQTRKARVRSMHYQLPIPVERAEQVQQAIAKMRSASTLLVERNGRKQPIDIVADLISIELRGNMVHFRLRAADHASARPRDVLQALGLADLEQQGLFLTRSEVEVTC